MRIGGFQKLSLIDYPKKVAAVIFTQGCDFRCPFCHNPDLVLPEKFLPPISEDEIFKFLAKRQGQLTGVVVTGGEPTIHQDLPVFLKKIKDLGYCVKLDTNGNNPDALKDLFDQELIDYVAMDIKTSFERYAQAVGVSVHIENIQRSIDLIIASKSEYHFRTTVVHKFISEKELQDISLSLSQAKKYLLQAFVADQLILDKTLKDERTYTEEEFKKLQKDWEKK
ncbi:MAG: anaerobic ribonucleoside-triphosphate reductase activating protein [Candidatus Omnitrophota bacterium]